MSTRPMGKGVVWCLRKGSTDYVRPVGEEIVFWVGFRRITMDRATARLLAKRINECLDATVKK